MQYLSQDFGGFLRTCESAGNIRKTKSNKAMDRSFLAVIFAGISLFTTLTSNAQVKDVANNYGIKISVPEAWVLDTAAMRNAKVKLTELLTAIKTEGKVRILNTGTAPGAVEGYSRVRLNITSDLTLSQADVANLTDEDLKELEAAFAPELVAMPLFRVERESISVASTRTDDGFLGIRLSYVRSGTNGPVKVHQYWFPFSNRAAQLTLSYEVAKQDVLWPPLLKVLSSLRLTDQELWPKP